MLTCANCGRQSPDDFAFCPVCASPLAAPAAGREVRKAVTVVFCDVTGSTALGERLDPESLRDVQTRYFDAMRATIARHGGTVEKYIGDAVMAVFGIPRLHEDDALRAIRAAAAMREALTLLNKELERDRGVTIQVRIGVNTGEVVAGEDATGGQALVTGDAVNVAARLEQHAAPGEVLIGEATHRLVRDAVEVEPVRPVEAKGKSEPVPAFRLVEVRDVASAVPRRLDSPMVGRERPLAVLRDAFEGVVRDRACHLVTVLGDAGVGKSRLVEEFLGGVGDAEVLRGRCLAYGEGITYFPVVEAIKQASGLADFDLADVVESKVCSLLQGEEHQDLICRHVTQLMGVGDATAGEETFWAVRRFFEAASRDRPLVLVFDDIHWGEPTFLDLVEHIAVWTRGSAILLLCMARPDLLDVRAQWGGGKLEATTISLEPLDEEETGALVANLVGEGDLPASVARRVVGAAEGNPLYVEQTMAMLIDDGRLRREAGRWIATGLEDLVVPPSIQALLAARIDQLSTEERAVIEAAAVIGQSFFVGAVRELVESPLRSEVQGLAMALVRRELVGPERSTLAGEDAMRFLHLTIRDAAYEAIPKRTRAELHERFATWLERTAGDAIAEYDEFVGYHLERAHGYRTELGPPDERSRDLAARAAAALAAAGRRALGRRDDAAGVNLLRRALALDAFDPAARATAMLELAEALWFESDPRGGFGAADEAAGIAAEIGDRSLEWRARIARSNYALLIDPHGTPTERVRSELEEAVGIFDELGDHEGWAIAWLGLADIAWMPMRYAVAERAALRALERADRIEARTVERAAITLLAAGMLGIATPDLMRRRADEMSALDLPSRMVEMVVLHVRAVAAAYDGRFPDARTIAAESRSIAEAIGSGFVVSIDREVAALIAIEAGDVAAAEPMRRRGYEASIEEGDEAHASTAASEWARCLALLGRFDEADRYASIGRDLAADDDVTTQSVACSTLAFVASARGDHEDAERLAREGVRILEDAEAESPMWIGLAWEDLARVLRAAGRRDDVAQAARKALEQFELKGARTSAERARALLEELSG